MKTIPFDLEKALAGAKVVTESGLEVTQLTRFDAPESMYHLFGVIEGDVHNWTLDGKYNLDRPDSEYNLRMAQVQQEFWVVKNSARSKGVAHPSESDAREEIGILSARYPSEAYTITHCKEVL